MSVARVHKKVQPLEQGTFFVSGNKTYSIIEIYRSVDIYQDELMMARCQNQETGNYVRWSIPKLIRARNEGHIVVIPIKKRKTALEADIEFMFETEKVK